MKFTHVFAVGVAMLGAALLFSQRLSSEEHNAKVDATAEKQILAVLHEQQVAWNRADIETFMQGYWKSPEVTFAGSSGVTRGWQPVLDRYRERYRDAQAMGQLDFHDVEVHLLGKDAAFVLGRWHLRRANDEPGGVFTLVFQRFPEGWRIVHDHTSVDAK
jgi:ketosteroid isomerase-like protein